MTDLAQNASVDSGSVSARFNIVTTTKIREKLAKCLAETGKLPVIKYLAFGSGGVDENGKAIPPDPTANALNKEEFRLPIDNVSYPITTTADLTVEVSQATYNGIALSEFGAVDSEGDFVGIQTFQTITKQDRVTLKFHWQCLF